MAQTPVFYANGQQVAVPGIQIAQPMSNCNSFTKAYSTPKQVTFNATSTSAATYKMPSADGVVEAILGDIGAGGSFTVSELPTTVNSVTGMQTLLRSLQTYAIMVEYINYSASAAAQLTNSITVYRGNIDGTNTRLSLSVSTDISNMQYNNALVKINGPLLITANTAISLYLNASTTVALAFKIASQVPYNSVL